MTLKALTTSQPYADLIADLEKWVENRVWGTELRGWIALHAGKGSQFLDRAELKKYTTGAIVALTKLTACIAHHQVSDQRNSFSPIPGTSKSWRQLWTHKHTHGPFCLIFEHTVKLIEPIPCAGAQKFWEVPEEVMQSLRDQVRTLRQRPFNAQRYEKQGTSEQHNVQSIEAFRDLWDAIALPRAEQQRRRRELAKARKQVLEW